MGVSLLFLRVVFQKQQSGNERSGFVTCFHLETVICIVDVHTPCCFTEGFIGQLSGSVLCRRRHVHRQTRCSRLRQRPGSSHKKSPTFFSATPPRCRENGRFKSHTMVRVFCRQQRTVRRLERAGRTIVLEVNCLSRIDETFQFQSYLKLSIARSIHTDHLCCMHVQYEQSGPAALSILSSEVAEGSRHRPE